jgi:hypothetical protein
MKKQKNDPAFVSDVIHTTQAAKHLIDLKDIKTAFKRHKACDWGLADNKERLKNDEAYKSGGKLQSWHISTDGNLFTLITSPGRSKTTVVLADAPSLKEVA